MIGRTLALTASGLFVGLVAGVGVSSFKHYYRKYADPVDLRNENIQEVVIIEDETKKSRRNKK